MLANSSSAYTGEYEDVKAVNDLLEERGLDCYIHVDAASGGFVAPFVNPDLIWDFRYADFEAVEAYLLIAGIDFLASSRSMSAGTSMVSSTLELVGSVSTSKMSRTVLISTGCMEEPRIPAPGIDLPHQLFGR